MTEAGFFAYANAAAAQEVPAREALAADARDTPVVRDALASIEHGGYVEALARVAFLLMRKGEPLPLSRLELRKELLPDYRGLPAGHVPARLAQDPRRAGNHRALRAAIGPSPRFPSLLDDPADRERLVTLLEKLTADRRVHASPATAAQVAMMGRIREALGIKARRKAAAAPRKSTSARRA